MIGSPPPAGVLIRTAADLRELVDKGRHLVSLWCHTCKGYVEVEGVVDASASPKFLRVGRDPLAGHRQSEHAA